jgi:two-component system, chemotaxis family, protein-glutamate methylesterase/glutaminase
MGPWTTRATILLHLDAGDNVPAQRIVVVGASAGGVEALMELTRSLPADFPAPIFVTIHVPPDSSSILPVILKRRGRLDATHAQDGMQFKPGVVYVAPPDHHMLIQRDGTLRVVRGPRENRHRPAIDPLFRGAAVAAGPAAIGVILSGTLDDGTAGLIAIKECGGTAVVQDPSEAVYSSMPQSAIENVDVDFVLPLRDIPKKLADLVTSNTGTPTKAPSNLEMLEMENRIAGMDARTMESDNRPGKPSAFSCPDCSGVLWEIDDHHYTRFRCRVGHAFSREPALSGQDHVLEEALWTAMKTLEESARLAKRLAAAEDERGHPWMASRFEARENDAHERAELIRRVLVSGTSEVPQPAEEELQANVRRQ